MKNRTISFALIAATAMVVLSSCLSLPKLDSATDINTQRLDRTMRSNPNNVHAQFLLGRSYLDSNDPGKAAMHFAKAIKLKPDFEEAWDGLGVARLDAGDYDTAISVYTQMRGKFPMSVAAAEGLANASLGSGNIADAERFAKEARALDANSPQAARILGEAAYESGDYATALAEWKKFVELDPFHGRELQKTIDDLTAYQKKYGK
ncbi:tetratricopeptide repeat protein [Candidatus Sumerlaeota bacterium]|nr:tetratricopeptide repeat protein [Candidatus Sumerlaeota bacterium]